MNNCESFPSSPSKMKLLLILLHVSQLWATSSAELTAEAARKGKHMLLGADALLDMKRDTGWVGDAISDARMPPGLYRAPGFQGGKRDTSSDARMPPGLYRAPGFQGGKRDTVSDARMPPGLYRAPGFQGGN